MFRTWSKMGAKREGGLGPKAKECCWVRISYQRGSVENELHALTQGRK